MTTAPQMKPTHKAIKQYYARLEEIAAQRVSHEQAVRDAFKEVLYEASRLRKWRASSIAARVPGSKTSNSPARTGSPRPAGPCRRS